MTWVDSGQQPNTQPAPLSLPSPMGWEENRRQARRQIGGGNDNSIGKAEGVCADKAIRGIHSLLPIGKQMISHFLEKRASAHAAVAWETNAITANMFPFLFLSLSFYCWVKCHII